MKRKIEADISKKQNHIKLIEVIIVGDIEEVERLIAEMNNEEINATDDDGRAALHYAAFGGHKEVCELLLIRMSPVVINVVDKVGWTVLH